MSKKWEGDICEKCGSKDFERTNDAKDGYNFMRCKNCKAVYLDD